jgi:type I restriction enzyme M protein
LKPLFKDGKSLSRRAPGRYVGAAAVEDDGIPFETKMTELSDTLYGQMKESAKLDAVIRANLNALGYKE